MTSMGPMEGFSLTYELQPDDLQELIATDTRRRGRRRLIGAAVGWALINAAFTAVMVALDLPSVVKNSSGAPSWMYVVNAAIWFFVIYCAVAAWHLKPKRLTLRFWRRNPQYHGIHRDEVSSSGITAVAPDGTQVSTPWASIAQIRETEKAFHLLDQHDAIRCVLPKRGLPSPDLIPALREFLNRSINGQQSPAVQPEETV